MSESHFRMVACAILAAAEAGGASRDELQKSYAHWFLNLYDLPHSPPPGGKEEDWD